MSHEFNLHELDMLNLLLKDDAIPERKKNEKKRLFEHSFENDSPVKLKNLKKEISQESRLERNRREQDRSRRITELICDLKKLFPDFEFTKKHEILQNAINFIKKKKNNEIQSKESVQNSNTYEDQRFQIYKKLFEESIQPVGFFDLTGNMILRNNAFINRFGDESLLILLTCSTSSMKAVYFENMAKILSGEIEQFSIGIVLIKKFILNETVLKVTSLSYNFSQASI